MKYNSKTTAIPEIIPVVLICTAGIISAARMHPYLAFLFHRDYFRRPDASLSSSFAPQGLFRPTRCISAFLFCPTGIISTGWMHLYLALFFHRDYFHRPDASLSCSFVPLGLFPPVECISIFLFCSTGIISAGQMHLYLALFFTGIISAARMHPQLALFFHRDYFDQPDASLSSSFASQGLFLSPGFIPSLLFSSTGIISASQMHPCLPLLSHRDYFAPVGCISIFLFCFTGIISVGRIHPCLPLLLHRDYFDRPDASLSSSFASQGLFPSPEFISILLFCSTGIILPRPDASLSCSFLPQG